MRKIITSLVMAIFLITASVPVFAEAKIAAVPAAKAVKQAVKTKSAKAKPVVKKTLVKSAGKKTSVKTTVKPAVKKVAPVVIAVARDVETEEDAVSSVSNSAVVKPAASCMRAISQANKFCAKIARGCSSQSKTVKCVAANERCEVEQQEALALCPLAKQ